MKQKIFMVTLFVTAMSTGKFISPDLRAEENSSVKHPSTTTLGLQEKKKPSMNKTIQAWLNKMKRKIAMSQTKQNKLISVAAVRGDEKTDAPPLYWKGKGSSSTVQLPELKEFDDAVNTALNGDSASAKSKLDSFISTHPKSPLMDDAKQTLNLLSENQPAP